MGASVKFRAIPHNGWRPLDPEWVYAVQRYARGAWVRIQGINLAATANERYRDSRRDPEVYLANAVAMPWEAAMTRHGRMMGIDGLQRRCAFLHVYFWRWRQRAERGREGRGLIDGSDACRAAWPEHTPVLAPALFRLLVSLRQRFAYPIGICAEDFSARWLMASGFTPDATVLDTPMVSMEEGERWRVTKRPLAVRRARWPALGFFDDWKLQFAFDNLLPGLGSRKEHGHW
jgi:hypothetical protein